MLEGEEPACGVVGPALVAKRRAMDAVAPADANARPLELGKPRRRGFPPAPTAFIFIRIDE